MAFDLTPYFQQYEALRKNVDQIFGNVAQEYSDQVRCGKGCSDCCYALFDLTLVEAMYINYHFNRQFEGMERSTILQRADDADREIYRLKRKVFKASQEGKDTAEILRQVSEQKVRCPLLGDDDLCVLYDYRPVTCRLYGIPTVIGDAAHTCHRSAFEPGRSYPTVQMSRLQEALFDLSHQMVRGIRSKYSDLGNMLVPPSMALLTDYDEAYLNIAEEGELLPHEMPQDAGCSSCGQDQASCGQDPSACAGCSPDQSIVIGQTDDDSEEE